MAQPLFPNLKPVLPGREKGPAFSMSVQKWRISLSKLGVGEGQLGTTLSLLPKNRSGSGEVDSAGTIEISVNGLDIFLSTTTLITVTASGNDYIVTVREAEKNVYIPRIGLPFWLP
jgi:hypothetical protein